MQLFNIGGEGQLYAGAIVGAAAGLVLGDHSGWLSLPAMFDAGAAGRAALLEARGQQLLGPGPWIHVRGAPAGASVMLDEKPVGVLPYRGAISPGDHELLVHADGYNAKRQPIVIPLEPTTTARVELELAPNDAPAAAPPPAEATPALANDYVSEDPNHAPRDEASAWNYVLGGLAIAGGVALATIEPAQTFAKDGDCANDACTERYAAGGETALKIGAGALIAAAGVTFMIWQPIRVSAELGADRAILHGRAHF
jgi:hypothetical protein